jgi:glycosyltransferase involved in cell wall biosynthesis
VVELAEAWPRVAEALPGARLLLGGKGRMEGRMRALLGDTPGVEWLGYRDDVPALLERIDVVVVPSRSEGFGMTALEAMAAGAAVVATRAGGLPELVRDGVEGRLVPPRDAAALAQAMVAVGGDPHLSASFGRAGMRRARAYTLERMVRGTEAVLRAAASSR